jgi:hypothetical protein
MTDTVRLGLIVHWNAGGYDRLGTDLGRIQEKRRTVRLIQIAANSTDSEISKLRWVESIPESGKS